MLTFSISFGRQYGQQERLDFRGKESGLLDASYLPNEGEISEFIATKSLPYQSAGVITKAANPVFQIHYCFRSDCKLKTEMPDEVCTTSNFIEYIRSINDEIFSDVQINELCEKIKSVRLEPTRETHRDHVKRLKRK